MAVISGGNVIPPAAAGANPGIRPTIYSVDGVPTDANLGLPAAVLTNGMLAVNVNTGFLYERTAGAWVRRDTL